MFSPGNHTNDEDDKDEEDDENDEDDEAWSQTTANEGRRRTFLLIPRTNSSLQLLSSNNNRSGRASLGPQANNTYSPYTLQRF